MPTTSPASSARVGGAVLAQFDGDLVDLATDASLLNVKALGENTATATTNVGSVSIGGAGSGAGRVSILPKALPTPPRRAKKASRAKS